MRIYFMSIPNVYPGPLRFVKQPGKAKTAQIPSKMKENKENNIL